MFTVNKQKYLCRYRLPSGYGIFTLHSDCERILSYLYYDNNEQLRFPKSIFIAWFCVAHANDVQCDQIWRKFTIWVTFYKPLANLLRVYLVCVKILNLLWQLLLYWANFHCFKRPNVEQIIWSHWSLDNYSKTTSIWFQTYPCSWSFNISLCAKGIIRENCIFMLLPRSHIKHRNITRW